MASSNKKTQRLAALQSEDVNIRKDAARWLGEKGIQDAVAPLIVALHDSSWKVRRNAAAALGRIGNTEAVEPLLSALQERTISVRRAAILALGQLRDARATESLAAFLRDPKMRDDALRALMQIGAPALLHCCRQMQKPQSTTVELTSPWREAVQEMFMRNADPLLKEVLGASGWKGQERWLALETVRTLQSSLSFLDVWRLSKFSRITEIHGWCDRISRDAAQTALHPGAREVLDYIMLGRASQRDYGTESSELLRGASGTKGRDTGATLLRASEQGQTDPQAPGKLSLLTRLRRWLGQEG